MARNTATVERLRGGVDRLVGRAVDATVHLPLGIYDRTRDQLNDVDAKRVRKTFEALLEDFIDRGHDRVQPLERRLKRERRRVEADVPEAVGEANKTTKRTTKRAKKTTEKTARKATAAAGQARSDRRTNASNAKPKLARATAPRTAGELPIASYASLTADEIVSQLTGLTQTDLARVYKYEKAHENRATILNAIDDKLVDLPIPTYDALTADEIVERLGKLDKSELKSIKRYEAATKKRATVLERIDSLLS